MSFGFSPTAIPEVMVIDPRVFPDQRGFFMETYKCSEFAAHGITGTFVQCNHSKSSKGILRGLHYQKHPKAQCKLVRAVSGEIYDVVVDLRQGGPTYGKWIAVELSGENRKMLYIPTGFAHGFCVTSEEAEILYMATEEYAPEYEAGVFWNDAELAIDWPLAEPQLSSRDHAWPPLKWAENNFRYNAVA
ncbi:MAG: dTDP-4-dehydrorhamnose 3,5-epimerase [Deltaproteobacteria bacterium]|jgi:dTDP-4-dehydrorhamnose 3,5-epimerase|nr:MAG: dTDP-4-dehydrorhamnose 3,5-epimerase [Deltaproteobacteria bacterium]